MVVFFLIVRSNRYVVGHEKFMMNPDDEGRRHDIAFPNFAGKLAVFMATYSQLLKASSREAVLVKRNQHDVCIDQGLQATELVNTVG